MRYLLQTSGNDARQSAYLLLTLSPADVQLLQRRVAAFQRLNNTDSALSELSFCVPGLTVIRLGTVLTDEATAVDIEDELGTKDYTSIPDTYWLPAFTEAELVSVDCERVILNDEQLWYAWYEGDLYCESGLLPLTLILELDTAKMTRPETPT